MPIKCKTVFKYGVKDDADQQSSPASPRTPTSTPMPHATLGKTSSVRIVKAKKWSKPRTIADDMKEQHAEVGCNAYMPEAFVSRHMLAGKFRTVRIGDGCPKRERRVCEDRTITIDDFTIIKRIGYGKTSMVYKAIFKPTGTIVALKQYQRTLLSLMNYRQIEREISIHSSLLHENILRFHVAFEDSRNIFLITEYCDSGDLFHLLQSYPGGMPEKYFVCNILVPFLSALEYITSRGIIHRDIKPENIFLSRSGVVKVADFGLSINTFRERPCTRLGTLDYMAPEVLLCSDKSSRSKDDPTEYDNKVDSWAVGVLAHEMITGKAPFEAPDRETSIEMIMFSDISESFKPIMSDLAKSFISSCSCKEAAKRPTIAQIMESKWIQKCKEAEFPEALDPAKLELLVISDKPKAMGKTSESPSPVSVHSPLEVSDESDSDSDGSPTASPAELPVKGRNNPFKKWWNRQLDTASPSLVATA